MELKGKITKINKELGYGFVTVKKIGNVFFSEETKSEDIQFNDLKIDQPVTISAAETPRGLFATKFNFIEPNASLSL